MRSWAVGLGLALTAIAAGGAALFACATATDTSGLPGMGFTGNGSSSGGGSSSSGGSSGGMDDATVSGSSSGYGGSSSSSSGAADDTGTVGTDSGDDGGSNTPGPTCTPGQACVDGIPSGWTGFVQLVVQAGDAGAGCAAPYDTVQPQLGGQTNPDGGPATCGTCNCFVPDAGVTCSVGIGTGNLGCTPNGPTSPAAANTCMTLPALTGASGQVTSPTLTSGSCQAGPVSVTSPPPPPSFATATACASSADGGSPVADGGGGSTGPTCASGQACAVLPATADAGMPSGVCIYQAGVQTCPPSGTTLFTNTFVVGAVEDTRGCGCTCGAMACPGDGYVNAYSAGNCGGTATVLDAGAACKLFGISQTSFKYIPSRSGSPGTCGAATGGPSGAVDIDGGTATTFCCIP